jgi:hypothetical protein
MTPQEKANQLVNKFYRIIHPYTLNSYYNSKKSGLILVDEIIETIKSIPYGLEYLIKIEYWEEVREEIEKL